MSLYSMSSQMQVLHITQSLAGGPASYFEEIASYQSNVFGVDGVRFLIPAGSRSYIPSIPERQIIQFHPGDRSIVGLFAFGLAAYKSIRSLDPTIIHLHSTFAGAVVRPTFLLGRRRGKVVYCAHGWAFSMEVPEWKKKLYSMVEHCLLPLTDAVLNISNSEHHLAVLHGLPLDKMKTIRNGINVNLPKRIGSGISFPTEKINLIFVGRHDRQKGLDLLLDIFTTASLNDVHLHVIGAPVVSGKHPTADLARASNITFYGWIDRDVVSQMICSADALIMPSRWEGFGLTALEAMRLGKPVIASRRGALSEIIEDGRTGLHFNLEAPSELITILRNLDRDFLRRLGDNGQQEFLRSFSSERMNREIVDLYRSLVGV